MREVWRRSHRGRSIWTLPGLPFGILFDHYGPVCTLNLSLIDGFEPSLGETFVILTHASSSGTFGSINNPEIGHGKRFQATDSPTELTLEVVPSP